MCMFEAQCVEHETLNRLSLACSPGHYETHPELEERAPGPGIDVPPVFVIRRSFCLGVSYVFLKEMLVLYCYRVNVILFIDEYIGKCSGAYQSHLNRPDKWVKIGGFLRQPTQSSFQWMRVFRR